jgi:hypothetical protein
MIRAFCPSPFYLASLACRTYRLAVQLGAAVPASHVPAGYWPLRSQMPRREEETQQGGPGLELPNRTLSVPACATERLLTPRYHIAGACR